MNIIFRVDASVEIGSGHVMRCITLAEKLKFNGHDIEFICREVNGTLISELEERLYKVNKLPLIKERIWNWTSQFWETDLNQTINIIENKRVDLLIIDHYSIDFKWEEKVSKYVKRLMVIDDLANRKHFCDILLDHNYYLNYDKRYRGLLKESTIKLLGPSFALLKDDFFYKEGNIDKDSILISFGGSDPTNETQRIIEILLENQFSEQFKIVIGVNNVNKDKIRNLISDQSNMLYMFNIDNMAEVMKNVNFIIGAGGVSAIERIALGIPSLVITVAENQIEIAESLANKKMIEYIGYYNEVDNTKITNTIKKLINNENKIVDIMRQNCIDFFPPFNTTERVVSIIEEQF